MDTHTITIESMAISGHGIGYLPDNSAVHVLGAFPKDVVEIHVYKKAEGITYGEIVSIVTPSPFRTESPQQRPFFDANAPWRYLSYEKEIAIKEQLLRDVFQSVASTTLDSTVFVSPEAKEYHYRNKAAYSFLYHQNALHFALYPRGTSETKKCIQEENILVHEVINHAGTIILQFLNQKKVPLTILKYLILRYSYHTRSVVAHLLVTETSRKKLPWKKAHLDILIEQHDIIDGIIVSQSEASVRSATTIKDFYGLGNCSIKEMVAGYMYHYHPSQFFQIYPQSFEDILKDCVACINSIPKHSEYKLLDLFAGVGIIGLHLSKYVASVHGVEQSPLSETYALLNAQINGVSNFSYDEGNVDTLLSFIERNQILVVDPPRSGLSKNTLSAITAALPEYILYISCDPQTQAENYIQLQEYYHIQHSQGYNLFPKTSHIEHLLFLKRKEDILV